MASKIEKLKAKLPPEAQPIDEDKEIENMLADEVTGWGPITETEAYKNRGKKKLNPKYNEYDMTGEDKLMPTKKKPKPKK